MRLSHSKIVDIRMALGKSMLRLGDVIEGVKGRYSKTFPVEGESEIEE